MHSSCSFWCMSICSFFIKSGRFFFLTTIDSPVTLHLALGLVDTDFTASWMLVVIKFLYSSFGVCFHFITLCSYHKFYPYWQVEIRNIMKFYLFVSYFCRDSCVSLLRQFCDQNMLFSKEEYSSRFNLSIYPLLSYEYII